jgi:hypothetical protein
VRHISQFLLRGDYLCHSLADDLLTLLQPTGPEGACVVKIIRADILSSVPEWHPCDALGKHLLAVWSCDKPLLCIAGSVPRWLYVSPDRSDIRLLRSQQARNSLVYRFSGLAC